MSFVFNCFASFLHHVRLFCSGLWLPPDVSDGGRLSDGERGLRWRQTLLAGTHQSVTLGSVTLLVGAAYFGVKSVVRSVVIKQLFLHRRQQFIEDSEGGGENEPKMNINHRKSPEVYLPKPPVAVLPHLNL